LIVFQLFKNKKNKSSEEIDPKLDLKKNDVNNGQKAKPNKELLEKLKEEMRKLIKKPQSASETEPSIDNVVIAAIKNNSNNEQNLVHDSILTIPPLYLGNNEFQLSSDTFLMNKSTKNENENSKDEEDGKILFTSIRNDEGNKVETLRFDKNITANANNNNNNNNNKRKLSENDSDEDDESEEEDDEDENEEENESDENISSECSENNDRI
jgi:hypothetical protein